MHDLILYVITVFMGFFAIMNPLANTSIFLGLTQDLDDREKKAVARKSMLIAFVIVLLFALMGKLIFELFGITLPAFRITGGILVFIIGFNLLHGGASKVQTPHAKDVENTKEVELSIAVSPLAMPILAGPGTIATAMNFTAKATPTQIGVVIAAFACLSLITYLMFVSGEKLIRYLGDGAIKVVSRLMGLILAVIGTQMVINGIQGAFHLGGQ